MTESSVFPVWRNSQFTHRSDASVNDNGMNRMKEQSFENLIAYVIKNFFFFFFFFFFSENSFISNCIEKSTQ